jgi:hypothetical protein
MIKKVTPRVKKLLEENPELRDDFNKTLAKIWLKDVVDVQVKRDRNVNPDLCEFLTLLSCGELTSPESVRRAWQLLQQKNESLRGKKYNFRHKVKEPETRQEIQEIEWENPDI